MCGISGHLRGSVNLANVQKLRGRERHLTNLRNSSEYPRHGTLVTLPPGGFLLYERKVFEALLLRRPDSSDRPAAAMGSIITK